MLMLHVLQIDSIQISSDGLIKYGIRCGFLQIFTHWKQQGIICMHWLIISKAKDCLKCMTSFVLLWVSFNRTDN